jgi:uncharacterized membrane protein
MPRWLAYVLLALTLVAAVLVVASGNGLVAFVALVVVALIWTFTMQRTAK